jgi:hypothetical protein
LTSWPAATLPGIGPHEGRELELMMSGLKPLAMFSEPIPPDFDYFDEEQFDLLVAQGRLVKSVTFENSGIPNHQDKQFRRVLYALPDQEWRIGAFLALVKIQNAFRLGLSPCLERLIGLLLGYESADIESYLDHIERCARH